MTVRGIQKVRTHLYLSMILLQAKPLATGLARLGTECGKGGLETAHFKGDKRPNSTITAVTGLGPYPCRGLAQAGSLFGLSGVFVSLSIHSLIGLNKAKLTHGGIALSIGWDARHGFVWGGGPRGLRRFGWVGKTSGACDRVNYRSQEFRKACGNRLLQGTPYQCWPNPGPAPSLGLTDSSSRSR